MLQSMPVTGHHLPAWEPRGDLLYEPQIGVGIAERAERPVARALWVGSRVTRFGGNGGPCHTSLTSMPRPTNSSWAAFMSETTSAPWVDPGAAVVSPFPKVMEVPDPAV